MPSHRAAGSVLDADVDVDVHAEAGSVGLASVEEWEGLLRSRTGWATAPVPVVPAQGARRTGPLPVTAFVPSQRSRRPAGAPAAPAPAAPVLPAPRDAEPSAARPAGRSQGRRALAAAEALAAPLPPLAADPAADAGTAPAAVTAPTASAPLRPRPGRRRADLPPLPREPLAEVPPSSPPRLTGDVPAPLPRRARRRSQAPLDAAPPAPLPVRPGGRRAQRLAAAGDLPVRADLAGAGDHPAWAEQVEADDAVLLQLERALSLPPAERAWTPSALPHDLPHDLPRLRVGELFAPADVLPPVPDGQPYPPRYPEPAPEPLPAGTAFTPARGRSAHRLPGRVVSVLPQVGVVGVLGLATLVAPMVGDLLPATSGGEAAAASSTGAALSAAPASAAAEAAVSTGGARQLASAAKAAAGGAQALVDGRAATQVVSRASTRAQLAHQQAAVEKAAADRAAADRAAADRAAAEHRAQVAALVPGCDGATPDTTGERNGRLPDSQLCSLDWQQGHRLRSDAAVALAELDLAYRAHFGSDISLTDSYRSYSEQVRVRREKPDLAARPGTSEHGWGLAVDMGDGVQDADEHYDWLIANAPRYGWDHPAWARRGGGGPYEPWHWEYVAGEE